MIMKIFVCATTKNQQSANSLKRLLLALERLGNEIYCYPTNNINGSIEKYIIPPTEKILPDIVIAFNRGGLRIAKKIYTNFNIPIIYSFCYSELNNEYNGKWGEWDHLFVINDSTNFNKRIFPDEFTTIFNLNNPPCEFILYQADKTNLIFRVEFDDVYPINSIFAGLAPAFNNLPHIKFQITGARIYPSIYFNANVKFSNVTTFNVNLIIGSGQIIEKAIAHSIPCIVVGARGFGGLITKVNFEKQIESGFQGRIGGEIGEYIPAKVLVDEILNFIDMDKDQINSILCENYNDLCQYYQRTSDQLLKIISQTCKYKKNHNEDLLSLKTKIFGVIFYSSKKKKSI